MSVGRNTLWVFLSRLLSVVLTLGTSIFLTRALGVQGRGEFALFMASAGVLALLLGWGIDPAIRYFVAQQKLDFSAIAASLGVYLAALGPVLFLLVHLNDVLLANELLLPSSIQTMTVEALLVATVLANIGFAGVSSMLAGTMDFKPLNILSVALASTSFVVYGVLWFAKELGWFEVNTVLILAAQLILAAANLTTLGLIVRRRLGIRLPSPLVSRAMLLRMVRYGSMAYLARLLQFLNYRVDYWIVQHFKGDEALGLYSLASSLAMMLWMLPRAGASVLLPATAAGDVGATAAHAARMSRVSVGVGAALMAPLVPFARWWIALLFGEDFAESATPFVILLAGCIPFIASIVLASSLAGVNRLDINLRASGAGLIVTVVLDILLIPKWGLEGAAVASAASYLVTTGIVVASFSQMHGIPIRAYLIPTRSDLKYVVDGFRRLLR
jgi:O-antigen/teichoic acid export membrane protein